MRNVELNDETWFDFQEACRWHKDNNNIPCRHTCSKDYGHISTICDEYFCERLKKVSFTENKKEEYPQCL